MAEIGFASIPAIVVICYLVAELLKATSIDNKWLPVTCGFLGGVLGAIALYAMPDFPAQDIFTAIAIGVASGFAATGIHQAGKQLK